MRRSGHCERFAADALCDTGNAAVGLGTATTALRGLFSVVVAVHTLQVEIRSGMFGEPHPTTWPP
ncbi:hypothetical protein ACFY3O_36460 [Streptomyces sp. NPDC001046]|uniref:hypothetical protein n=1 Tax=Streptomyces sp. NPDC001046 TaxID=3364543 RepID=UPI0036CF223D